MTPLAVTGLGAVSPLARDRAGLLYALAPNGNTAAPFALPTLFPAGTYPGASVAEVRDFDPTPVLGDKGLRNLDRLTKLFLVASRHALEDAGIKRGGQFAVYSGPRAGVCASTAYGSLEAMTELNRVAVLENPRYLNPSKFPNTVINSALGYVSIWDDLRALNATVCNGNCGALDAVLCAEMFLASGRADVILLGGAEAMHEALYLAFDRLGALATEDRAYAPGDPRSEGMRLGEGAVLLAVELADAARARGASVLGEVTGYGTYFEPPESEAMIIHVHPSPIARAIELALADAGLEPGAVDAVVRCANGVALYDAAEDEALARVFGARRPEAVCPKALVGETLGASGAFGLVSALAWLDAARGSKPRNVLVTAVGFYGNASATVVRGG